jgi:hypothetical protein
MTSVAPGIAEIFPVTVTDPNIDFPPDPSAIPGLMIWKYAGTDPLGALGNLAPGGATLTALGVGPTENADNTETISPGSVSGGYNTGIVWNAGVMAVGWTMMFAVRNTGAIATLVSVGGSSGFFQVRFNPAAAYLSNQPAIGLTVNSAAPDATTSLAVPDGFADLKVYGVAWAGDGTNIEIDDYTDDLTGTTTAAVTMAAQTGPMYIGHLLSGAITNPIDEALFMYSGYVNRATRLGYYASMQTILQKIRDFPTA